MAAARELPQQEGRRGNRWPNRGLISESLGKRSSALGCSEFSGPPPRKGELFPKAVVGGRFDGRPESVSAVGQNLNSARQIKTSNTCYIQTRHRRRSGLAFIY